MTTKTAEKIALMLFQLRHEDTNAKVIELSQNLFSKMQTEGLMFTDWALKGYVNLYIYTQQWSDLLNVLNYSDANKVNLDKRSINLIKENMIYIIELDVRNSIRAATDKFESKNTTFTLD
jgi:hypothetical protein